MPLASGTYIIYMYVTCTCMYFLYSGQHKAAVLSLALPEPGMVITGGMEKCVRLFDIRSPNSMPTICGRHAKSVLSLCTNGWYVYSGSDDRCVKVWDTREPGEPVTVVKVGGAAWIMVIVCVCGHRPGALSRVRVLITVYCRRPLVPTWLFMRPPMAALLCTQ